MSDDDFRRALSELRDALQHLTVWSVPPGYVAHEAGAEAVQVVKADDLRALLAAHPVASPAGQDEMGSTPLQASEADDLERESTAICTARSCAAGTRSAALALREAEFEIRDAKTLDATAKAAVCAVLRGRARRIETGDDR